MGKGKSKKHQGSSSTAPEQKGEESYHVLSGNRGYLKVSYTPHIDGDQFSMAYGCPRQFAQDNGRILGYDTRHGHDPIEFGPCHRHYLAQKHPYPVAQYPVVYEIFAAQWPAIDKHFKEHGSLNNFTLPE